ncbi:hypothetical protein B0H11DRAFT_2315816 [Mycena galericulata]|nr:hypothetical protein B0H11DRAFT_2315816 [Mycena galericulata]
MLRAQVVSSAVAVPAIDVLHVSVQCRCPAGWMLVVRVYRVRTSARALRRQHPVYHSIYVAFAGVSNSSPISGIFPYFHQRGDIAVEGDDSDFRDDATGPAVVKPGGSSRTLETSSHRSEADVSRCQASVGVIRKGGVESRIDVITLAYVAPELAADLKRPRTINRAGRDRFITSRDHTFKVPSQIAINVPPGSPSHTARLAAAAGVPLNRRILGYDM